MTKKLEHRGKTFEYTDEATQDAQAVWGVDLVKFAEASIDALVEQGVEFYTLTVEVTKSEEGTAIRASPSA